MPTSDAFISAGMTYRQIDHWTKQGYIKDRSLHGRTKGSGVRRVWETRELDVAKRMMKLIEAGFTLEKAARIARTDPLDSLDLGHGLTLVAEGLPPLTPLPVLPSRDDGDAAL